MIYLVLFWEVVGEEGEEGEEEGKEPGGLTTAGWQVGFSLLPLLFGGEGEGTVTMTYNYALGR